MKKNINYILLFLLSSSFSACQFLDVTEYFEKNNTPDSVWTNSKYIMSYMWTQAAMLPDEARIWSNSYYPGVTGSDEGFVQYNTNQFIGNNYLFGTVNANSINGTSLNIWSGCYTIIRNCNRIFANKAKANLTYNEDKELTAYTRFLRAYAYYHLILSYGPVILLGDEVVNNNALPDDYASYVRSPFDSCVNYVCHEMETASIDMPLPDNLPQTVFGRPHKYSAWALVARLRLHAASKAFNSNDKAIELFSSFQRSTDGVHYIAQQYDDTKWALAALAAKRLISLNKYKLHTWPVSESTDEKQKPFFPSNFDGQQSHDPYLSYANMFNGNTRGQFNTEFIWGRNTSELNGHLNQSFPVGAEQLAGWGGMSIPYKIIQAYRKNDGTKFVEPTLSVEDPTRRNTTDRYFSGYWIKKDVDTLFLSREMRFYASIGFNRCNWPCLSISATASGSIGNNLTVLYHNGASSATGVVAGGKNIAEITNPNDYAITGFVSKKYIHPDDALSASTKRPQAELNYYKTYPIVRYAEILLNYAEALNNLQEVHTLDDPLTNTVYTLERNSTEIINTFNQIRHRVGLPGLPVLPDVELMNEEIREERMKEFFHEGRRYHDIRRWGVLEEEEGKVLEGMDTEKSEPDFYKVVPINHQYARDRALLPNKRKFYFVPIPVSELRKGRGIDQNPGWEK